MYTSITNDKIPFTMTFLNDDKVDPLWKGYVHFNQLFVEDPTVVVMNYKWNWNCGNVILIILIN